MKSDFARYQLPVIVWAVVIFVSSSLPSRDFPDLGIFRFDKLIHLSIYFLFCLFANRALKHQSAVPLLSRYSLLVSVLLSVAYGATDEIHQLFVAGRTSDVFDALADALGAGLYSGMVYGVHRRRASKAAPEA